MITLPFTCTYMCRACRSLFPIVRQVTGGGTTFPVAMAANAIMRTNHGQHLTEVCTRCSEHDSIVGIADLISVEPAE